MSANDTQIPVQYIKECFSSAEDGTLYWLARPRHHFNTDSACARFASMAGKKAGRINGRGYCTTDLTYQGGIFRLAAHRVMWVLHVGKWPEGVVDHINRVRSDNRLSNLRDVTAAENLRNNGNPRGTGLLGAYRSGDKFRSHIQAPHPPRYLGTFDTALEAHQAYLAGIGASK